MPGWIDDQAQIGALFQRIGREKPFPHCPTEGCTYCDAPVVKLVLPDANGSTDPEDISETELCLLWRSGTVKLMDPGDPEPYEGPILRAFDPN
ncbi:hypothetical protein KKH24_03310 [Patescibacteria group bacterium]|nr:hypothetical protein [Patescibacteria group bacterium]